MIHSYQFHDFLDIEIEQNNLPLHVNYEHYFSQIKTSLRSSAPDYVVREYETFRLPNSCFCNGNKNLGFDGGICFPSERYAVTYDGRCLTEYTEIANRATNLWLQLLLLGQGKSLVHSAGLRIAGKGFIFPALGGAGKSLLVGALRHRSDFELFGDDFVIVDDNSIMHAYLSDISLYRHHLQYFPELIGSPWQHYLERHATVERLYRLVPGGGLLRRVITRAMRRTLAQRTFPGTGWNLDYVKVPVSSVIPQTHLGKNSALDAAIYLSRSTEPDFRVEKISPHNLVNRIRSVLAVEFRYALPYLDFLGVFGGIAPSQFAGKEGEVLSRCFTSLDCYQVIIPRNFPSKDYVKQMTQFLESLGR